jgi:hypothetical protein
MSLSVVKVFFIHSSFGIKSKELPFEGAKIPNDYASDAFDALELDKQNIDPVDFDVVYFWSFFSPYFRTIDDEEINSPLSEFEKKQQDEHPEVNDLADKYHLFLMPSSQETELLPFKYFDAFNQQLEWSVLNLNQSLKDFELGTFSLLTNLYQSRSSRLARGPRFADDIEVFLYSLGGEDVALSDCLLIKGDLLYWSVDPESPEALNELGQLNFEELDKMIETAEIFFTQSEPINTEITNEAIKSMFLLDDTSDNSLSDTSDNTNNDFSSFSLPILTELPPPQPSTPQTSTPQPQQITKKQKPTTSVTRRWVNQTSSSKRSPREQTLNFLSGSRSQKRKVSPSLTFESPEPSELTPLTSLATTEPKELKENIYIKHHVPKRQKTNLQTTKISTKPKITQLYFLPDPKKRVEQAEVIHLAFKSNTSSSSQVNQVLTSEQNEKYLQKKIQTFPIPPAMNNKNFVSCKSTFFHEQPLVDYSTLEYLLKNKSIQPFSHILASLNSFDGLSNELTRMEAVSRGFVSENAEYKISSEVYRWLDTALFYEMLIIDTLNLNSHFYQYLNDPTRKLPKLERIDISFWSSFVESHDDDSIRATGINLFILYFEYMIFEGGFFKMLHQIIKGVPKLLDIYTNKFEKQGYSLMDFLDCLFQINPERFKPQTFDLKFLFEILENDQDLYNNLLQAVKNNYFCEFNEFRVILFWFNESPKAIHSWSLNAANKYSLYHGLKETDAWLVLLYKQVHVFASRKFLRIHFARKKSDLKTRFTKLKHTLSVCQQKSKNCIIKKH